MMFYFATALAMQVASIPPALAEDPGAERRLAAAALFPREPYWPEYSWSINIAASTLAVETLTERKLIAYDRDHRLSDRLIARVKSAPTPLVEDAIRCVAEPLAQSMHVSDLEALEAFAKSPEGSVFWSFYFSSQPWEACFNQPVRVSGIVS